jgi:hypothetical protein
MRPRPCGALPDPESLEVSHEAGADHGTQRLRRQRSSLHRIGDDEAIDEEFSAVCRAIWGFTLDDFTDDDLSVEDHAWLDALTQECAIEFAAEQGYDLRDYIHGGCVADWWGFTWMVLAEARGVLTPEKRAAAWCRHGEKTWWA